MNAISERLQYLVDHYFNGNVSSFARNIGLRQSTVSGWIGTDGFSPSAKAIDKIINGNSLNINPDWLLNGREPITNKKLVIADSKRLPVTKSEYSDTDTIPYYPDKNVSAGLDFLTDNGNNKSATIRIPNVDAEAFVNVFGDSMYPEYCNGEIIGIKKIKKERVMFGYAYVVDMINGDACIKYIDPGKDGDHWILRSANPRYKEKQLHLSKIRNIYFIKVVISKTSIK